MKRNDLQMKCEDINVGDIVYHRYILKDGITSLNSYMKKRIIVSIGTI